MKFKNRHEYIGGSDFGAVLGVNPYKSRFQLILEKAQVLADTFEGNEATRRGEKLEDTVIQLFEEKAGLKVTDKQKTFSFEPLNDYFLKLLCHVDGMTEEDGKPVLFEAKTTDVGSKTWKNGIPEYYQAQLEFNMWLSKAETSYIAVAFCEDMEIKDFQYFKYDRKMSEKEIIDKCDLFSQEVKFYREKYGVLNDGEIIETKDISDEDITELDLINQKIAEKKKELKPLEEQKAAIETRLKTIIGNHSGITTGLYKITLGNRISAPTSEYKVCRSTLKFEYITDETNL